MTWIAPVAYMWTALTVASWCQSLGRSEKFYRNHPIIGDAVLAVVGATWPIFIAFMATVAIWRIWRRS